MAWRGLTTHQWHAIRVHLPPPQVSPRGGRPRLNDRRCLEGILWILWTGAQWSELPRRYGSPSTCWRRLKEWEETGVLLQLWRAFLAQLNDQQKLRWDECFADGSFIPAKKGERGSGKPSGARARSGWFWSMARVLRWEHTWRRLPQRKSPFSKGRSTQSRLGAPESRDDPASDPSDGLRIGAMTAIRCGPGWPVGVSSRSSQLAATTRTPRIKMAGSCDEIGGGGLSSARSQGSAISVAWSYGMNV